MAVGEAARHVVHERRLVNRVVLFPHEIEQRGVGVLVPSTSPADRGVQLLVRPAADLLGVIEEFGRRHRAGLRGCARVYTRRSTADPDRSRRRGQSGRQRSATRDRGAWRGRTPDRTLRWAEFQASGTAATATSPRRNCLLLPFGSAGTAAMERHDSLASSGYTPFDRTGWMRWTCSSPYSMRNNAYGGRRWWTFIRSYTSGHHSA